MAFRYISATAMGGRLYVQGIGESGPWDSSWLSYWPEAAVDLIFQSLIGDRKVGTAEELEDAIRSSERGLPAIKVWIHEGLEKQARKLWEESRTSLRRKQ